MKNCDFKLNSSLAITQNIKRKYLKTHLLKFVQCLYDENYKTPVEEVI